MQLTKMELLTLEEIRIGLMERVSETNGCLVGLLEERDALSMQRDALAVELRDLEDWERKRNETEERKSGKTEENGSGVTEREEAEERGSKLTEENGSGRIDAEVECEEESRKGSGERRSGEKGQFSGEATNRLFVD